MFGQGGVVVVSVQGKELESMILHPLTLSIFTSSETQKIKLKKKKYYKSDKASPNLKGKQRKAS